MERSEESVGSALGSGRARGQGDGFALSNPTHTTSLGSASPLA